MLPFIDYYFERRSEHLSSLRGTCAIPRTLINLQELLKLPVPRNVQYVFRKTDQNGFRDVLRDIKGRGIYSIVVDTKPDNLPHLLKALLDTDSMSPLVASTEIVSTLLLKAL
ncbi:hypothetical protein AVEN_24055-1 [Araneus ventricosus]|uniref:Uncharacterized protein n=1 Tax=Araneus ventricosus TaxID=182803 RepID=A0A4Y2WUI6_ARAVE|nr:hypothetical protein AVEN_240251-1 [Araneus ventricosus]GBO40853.1 hypothetical protein AVEN_24055-1 [Araneus ventricosus]